jgi:hypothetical protein
MVIRRALEAGLAAAWLLLHSADPDGRDPRWQPVGHYAWESLCERAREGETEREALSRIGSALASLPADNPMRQDAHRRAWAKAQARYRCTPE